MEAISQPVAAGNIARRTATIDLIERVVCVVLFTFLAVRLIPSIRSTPPNLLTLLSEGLVAVLILVRRPAKLITLRPIEWTVAFVGTFAPMLVAPGDKPIFATPLPGGILLFCALCWALWAKITLRRSFGIAAANRGVVEGGPYRWIRHPIYFGYVVSYVGFWINNPTARNACLYLLTIACFVRRIGCEEEILRQDAAYVRLADHVRYRLIPGLY